MNGFSAYDEIDTKELTKRLLLFLPWITIYKTDFKEFPFLDGIDAHYYKFKNIVWFRN